MAHQGIYNEVHTITKITNNNGDVLYEYEPQNKQLLQQDTCLMISQLLTAPFEKSFQSYASPTMMNYPVKNKVCCKNRFYTLRFFMCRLQSSIYPFKLGGI